MDSIRVLGVSGRKSHVHLISPFYLKDRRRGESSEADGPFEL